MIADVIRDHENKIEKAVRTVVPPAADDPSGRQARAYQNSLRKALAHNRGMADYAVAFTEKLRVSRARYETVEHENTGGLRRAGGGS